MTRKFIRVAVTVVLRVHCIAFYTSCSILKSSPCYPDQSIPIQSRHVQSRAAKLSAVQCSPIQSSPVQTNRVQSSQAMSSPIQSCAVQSSQGQSSPVKPIQDWHGLAWFPFSVSSCPKKKTQESRQKRKESRPPRSQIV